jgi:hypothetical protein
VFNKVKRYVVTTFNANMIFLSAVKAYPSTYANFVRRELKEYDSNTPSSHVRVERINRYRKYVGKHLAVMLSSISPCWNLANIDLSSGLQGLYVSMLAEKHTGHLMHYFAQRGLLSKMIALDYDKYIEAINDGNFISTSVWSDIFSEVYSNYDFKHQFTTILNVLNKYHIPQYTNGDISSDAIAKKAAIADRLIVQSNAIGYQHSPLNHIPLALEDVSVSMFEPMFIDRELCTLSKLLEE